MGRASSGTDACPCGSGRRYAQCCGRWHAGEPAPSAQALMRSRYSAYVLGLDEYLLQTWHPSTRPASLAGQDAAKTTWLGLEVRRVSDAAGAPSQVAANAAARDATRASSAPVPGEGGTALASVEFVARYRVGGRGQRLHETSRFVYQEGRWYYVDGLVRD